MSDTERRIAALIEKELDGELSSVEREELERLLARSPEARRRRAASMQAIESIARMARPGPPLDAARMARRVIDGAAQRRKQVPIKRIAPLAAIAAATVALWAGATKLAHPPPQHVEAPRIVEAKPVEVWIGEADIREEREPAPVSIRF